MIIKYEAVKCKCFAKECPDWHVSHVADIQGVSFTETEARFVAEALNKRNEEIEAAKAKTKKKTKKQSRGDRWGEAVSDAITALDAIDLGPLEEAVSKLNDVKQEFEDWKDNLPENLASSALGEKLDTIVDIDIGDVCDELQTAIDEVRSKVEEAEGVDIPLGFGRD